MTTSTNQNTSPSTSSCVPSAPSTKKMTASTSSPNLSSLSPTRGSSLPYPDDELTPERVKPTAATNPTTNSTIAENGVGLLQKQPPSLLISRTSSESAVQYLGPAIDLDIALLNEQQRKQELNSLGQVMRLLTRLVSCPTPSSSQSDGVGRERGQSLGNVYEEEEVEEGVIGGGGKDTKKQNVQKLDDNTDEKELKSKSKSRSKSRSKANAAAKGREEPVLGTDDSIVSDILDFGSGLLETMGILDHPSDGDATAPTSTRNRIANSSSSLNISADTAPISNRSTTNNPTITPSSPTPSSTCHTEQRLLQDIHTVLSQSDFLSTATPFPALLNSCIMLRESLRHTAREADIALADCQQATTAQASLQRDLHEARAEITLLRKENFQLKSERKALKRQVKSFVSAVESEKERELREAYALIAHEMALTPRVGANAPNRSRTHSRADSALSAASAPVAGATGNGSSDSLQLSAQHLRYSTPTDPDAMILPEDAFRAALAGNGATPSAAGGGGGPISPSASSLHSSRPPTPTLMGGSGHGGNGNPPGTPTLVSHGNRATVVISPDNSTRSLMGGPKIKQSLGWGGEGLSSHSNATAVGDGNNTTKAEAEDDDLVPAGSFLAARMNDSLIDRNPYTINFPAGQRIGLELLKIPVDLDNLDPNRNALTVHRKCKDAFLVTGYKKCYVQEQKPELGARLVSVNGESLEYGFWNLKKIGETILLKKSGSKLTFRNDELQDSMIVFLNKDNNRMSSKSAGEEAAHARQQQQQNQRSNSQASATTAAHRRAASTPKIPLLDLMNINAAVDSGTHLSSSVAATAAKSAPMRKESSMSIGGWRRLPRGSDHRKSRSEIPTVSPEPTGKHLKVLL